VADVPFIRRAAIFHIERELPFAVEQSKRRALPQLNAAAD